MDAPPNSRQLDHGNERNAENAASSDRDFRTGDRGENDDSMFRLPNGQVITSKNTIQSHIVLANEDHVAVNEVNDGQNDNDNHNDMFRLPNGQVITAKNTIPSDDNRAPLVGTRHPARHVEATPIFVDAWYARHQPQPPTLAALAVHETPRAEGLAIDSAATHNMTNAVNPVSDDNIATPSAGCDDATGQNEGDGSTNKFKKLGVRVALVVLVLGVTVLITLQLSASRRDASPPSSLPISSLRSAAPTVLLPSKSPATMLIPTLAPTTVSRSMDPQPDTTTSTAPIATMATVEPSPTLAPSFQSPLVAPSSPTSAAPSTEIPLPESTMAPSDGVVTLSRRATLLTNYINEIKLSNGTLTVPASFTPFDASTSTSSEQAALSWLVYNDPLQLWPAAPKNGSTNDNATQLQFRLQQRYAILTLLLQFSDFNVTSASNDECQWLPFAVTCVATTELGVADVVTEIDFIGYLTRPGSTLSSDLGLLTNLVSFGVASAGLTGRLPSSLGMSTWTSLAYFATYDNKLTGSIPSSMGTTWTNLEFFDVSGNALTGSLPASLGATWTNLARFDVSFNALTGSLPPTLGTSWTNLTRFDVESNALTGSIPSALSSHWNNLESAYFESNNFMGSIPHGFCTVGTLTWLSADCSTEVTCTCCDACCSDATGRCE